ncbi:hypothetical protein [Streptomyces sp. NPDC055109]
MTLSNTPKRERDPFLEAVGRVTLAGGEIDFGLRHLLGAIAPEPTLIFDANAASTDQLTRLCRLAVEVRQVEPADAAEIESCLKRVDDFRQRRNTIVHAIYSAAESGGFEAMNPLRKRLGYRVTSISVAEMEALADDVVILRSDLFRVGWNASAAHSGMERMPKPRSGEMVDGVPRP